MTAFISPDQIRTRFSSAMSEMYRTEVPLYGDLLALVADVNAEALEATPGLREHLRRTGELERLDAERHGAIRVGTAAELATLRRLFAVMGMEPVGYYDLTPAGVPVHSTAFRATHEASLQVSPFRVFTSLLRLELIENPALRELAERVLAKRRIFTPRVLELMEQAEARGGLDERDAAEFVAEALHTFRWHGQATVTPEEYRELHDQHRLIADVVAFKGPHINHLTPRTLDIDAVQAAMPLRGITPKAVIEGPPPRRCPILLRQTSFKALQEPVSFVDTDGRSHAGSHTARFGEIEQRGVARTPEGRKLYDALLARARENVAGSPTEQNAEAYMANLSASFADFPDDHETLRARGLAYYRYFVTEAGKGARIEQGATVDGLVKEGLLSYEPLVYEDFLPVSAAGIFQSNLGDGAQAQYQAASSRERFEAALGAPVLDELALYAQTQARSLAECARQLALETL